MTSPLRHRKLSIGSQADNTSPGVRRTAPLESGVIQYPSPRIDWETDAQKGLVSSQMHESIVPVSEPIDPLEEEGTIITAVLHGDLSEFEILVRRYQKQVYHFMLRATRQSMAAEDLTQDTFTRAYEKLHTFKRRKRFFPWLYSIAVNVCRDHLRRRNISSTLFAENSDDAQWSESMHNDCKNNAECLLEVERIAVQMEMLPLRYSEPMLLYYREGFTIEEISNALGISKAAVKVRIHRGREKLKRQLGVSNERA